MIFTLCVVAVLGLIAFAAHSLLSQDTKSAVANRIGSLIQTSSSSKPANAGQQKASDVDYSHVFPPSQRHLLAQVSPAAAAVSAVDSRDEQLLQFEEDYRDADPAKRIFSGFTVGEVKALGDFPNYAALSDVPLPSPLVDFDITKAMPRPYRPFRWSYHQTMCKRTELVPLQIISH